MKKLKYVLYAVFTVLSVCILFCVSAAAEDTNTYVSELMVSCNSDESAAAANLTQAGYTIVKKQGTSLNMDFNEGAKGDYVFIGYKTTHNFSDAIKQLVVIHWGSVHDTDGEKWGDAGGVITSPGKQYTLAPRTKTGKNPGDLNSGAGGTYLYLYYTKESSSATDCGALDASKIYGVSSSEALDYTEGRVLGYTGYILHYNDLNSGAGGKFIYLFAHSTVHTHKFYYDNTNASNHRTRCYDCDYDKMEAHLNEKYSNENYIEPTCTAIGTYDSVVRCQYCLRESSRRSKFWKDSTGHHIEYVAGTQPTCTVNGAIAHYACTNQNCGKVFTSNSASSETEMSELIIPAANHNTAINVPSTPATCMSAGYTAGRYCPVCQTYLSGHAVIPIDKNAHSWTTGQYLSVATCSSGGTIKYTCAHNSLHTKIDNTAVNPDNHSDAHITNAQAVTCMAKGYTQGVYCDGCNKYVSGHDEIPVDENAHVWNGGELIVVPTCIVNGSKKYVCTCNAEHIKIVDLGKNPDNHGSTHSTQAVAPTCTEKGYTAGSYCNNCEKYISGHAEIAVNANAHTWDSGVITVTSTCTVNGVKTYTCVNNSEHIRNDNIGINPDNHVNTHETQAVSPTCTEKGFTAGVYCDDCEKYISGHTEIAVNANAHTWDSGVITVTPTCTVNGVKKYTCVNNSEHIRNDNIGINPDNHVNTHETPAVSPTCTEKGFTAGVYCDDCEKYISGHDEIPVLSSGFTDSRAAVLADGKIIMKSGITTAELLLQAGEGAVIKKSGGGVLPDGELPGTGMKLVLPDLTEYELIIYGDIDGNGLITSADARLALRRAVNLESYEKGTAKYIACNVDFDTSVSAGDARLILRAAVKLEDPDKWIPEKPE